MVEQVQSSIAIVPGSLAAILERRPEEASGDRFLVVVDVEMEPGREAELAGAMPQGINPLIKLLRLKVGAPPSPAGVRRRRTLRYEEVPAAADYEQVWLGDGDAALSARVSLAL